MTFGFSTGPYPIPICESAGAPYGWNLQRGDRLGWMCTCWDGDVENDFFCPLLLVSDDADDDDDDEKSC